MKIEALYNETVELLQELVSLQSYSKFEDATAAAIEKFLFARDVNTERLSNNVWAVNNRFDPSKPTILLNSHHDTVRPNPQYFRDPFTPVIEDGKLYGLGSNDAGGSLVSLIAAFLFFYNQPDLKYNLLLAATAEEEISGHNGIELLLRNKIFQSVLNGKEPDCAIVGEPTKMNLAIAEKGLMVLDCTAYGKAGHAAREEGDNAIYKAMKDIEWFRTYHFSKVSEWLGPVKMSVTAVNTENKAHNMVPSSCTFVVDVRITELYSHEEIFETITQNIDCKVVPRSMRLRSTAISINHPLVQAAIGIGKTCYGSPTSSDKALMPFTALKCGPGDSARSHTVDEFIFLEEIRTGIEDYIAILTKILN